MPVQKTPAKKAAKKATTARSTATKKTAKKTVNAAKPKVAKKAPAAKKAAPKSRPQAEQPQAAPKASASNATDAFASRVNEFTEKATEQATVIGKQVLEAGKQFGKQAEAEIEKGKQFLRDHPTEAVVGALTAATLAGLAAARATYKAVRKR